MKMIDALYNAMVAHPALFLAIWTGSQYLFGVFAQSLRTPTANSSQGYVSCFMIVNAIAANWIRASIPKVENSPNFRDAVEKIQTNGVAANLQMSAKSGIPPGPDVKA